MRHPTLSPRPTSARPPEPVVEPPIRAEQEPDPSLEFLRLLWRLNHAMERRSRRMQRDLGVTGSQRIILRLVGENPGLSAGRLAQLLHVDPGTLSSALGRLEAMDLLAREYDPNDRRRVQIRVTPQGERYRRHDPDTIEGSVLRSLGARSPEEVRLVVAVLTELAVDMDRESVG
ncbi:MAG: MarR family transcriptional regulator [Gemmatimonadaceae bacterium]|nr:MarR family transcriptional regulator [Gemmatimonadaceae bacterium]